MAQVQKAVFLRGFTYAAIACRRHEQLGPHPVEPELPQEFHRPLVRVLAKRQLQRPRAATDFAAYVGQRQGLIGMRRHEILRPSHGARQQAALRIAGQGTRVIVAGRHQQAGHQVFLGVLRKAAAGL